MIILNDMPGQMCNRIWACAPYVALAHQGRQSLFVPFFGEYASHFPNINRFPGVRFARKDSAAYMRIARRMLKTARAAPDWLQRLLRMDISRESWGDENWGARAFDARARLVFLSGWNHERPFEDLRPFRDRLRTIFRPYEHVCTKVEAAISRHRQKADHIVGVHLRRGDYRSFLDGRYNFPDEVFARVMRETARHLGGRVAFLVCSNEPVDHDAFAGLDCFSLGAGPIEDLYGLSLADRIIGAPSTFSMWASFFGDVPMSVIIDAACLPQPEEASAVIGPVMFANGTRYTLREEAEAMYGRWNSAQ